MSTVRTVRDIQPKATPKYPSPTTPHKFHADIVPGKSIRIYGGHWMRNTLACEPDEVPGLDVLAHAEETGGFAWLVVADFLEERGCQCMDYVRRLCQRLNDGTTRPSNVAGDVETLRRHLIALAPHKPVYRMFDRTFRVGEEVAYDSYNLTYTGPIVAIGPNTVTINKGAGCKRCVRHDLHRFCGWNWDLDLKKIFDENHETMLTL